MWRREVRSASRWRRKTTFAISLVVKNSVQNAFKLGNLIGGINCSCRTVQKLLWVHLDYSSWTSVLRHTGVAAFGHEDPTWYWKIFFFLQGVCSIWNVINLALGVITVSFFILLIFIFQLNLVCSVICQINFWVFLISVLTVSRFSFGNGKEEWSLNYFFFFFF